MTITANDLIRREVHYCISGLVHTLAASHECFEPVTGFRFMDGAIAANVKELQALTEQAFELAAPVPDYESAAREEGWKTADLTPGLLLREGVGCDEGEIFEAYDWQEACAFEGVEPHDREVYEHWIVTDWLADKLAAKGEKVEKDFAGLTVWARTTTGQAIYLDSVIQEITEELDK